MRFFQTYYLSKRSFWILLVSVFINALGLVWLFANLLAFILLLALCVGILFDSIVLYSKKGLLECERILPTRLSNGDTHTVILRYRNLSSQKLLLEAYEDLPVQLQKLDWQKDLVIEAGSSLEFTYHISPKQRGNYQWGNHYLIARLSTFGLVSRKLTFDVEQSISSYPSFLQLKKLPLFAMVNHYNEANGTYIRKIGQSLEFEQIKNYVAGDDVRHINWKASAKQGSLMLNQYQEEKSQDIYCVLDLGRNMKSSFNEQQLLDYAINGGIGLSKAILDIKDRAGIITFSSEGCSILVAKREPQHLKTINESLFNISAASGETDFEKLYKFVRYRVLQRSLLIIFTNFDTVQSMQRNMSYLKGLSSRHLVLVISFENTAIRTFVEEEAKDLKGVYSKITAKNFLIQNRIIAKELNKHGIQSLIAKPNDLSIQVINKYLNIKKKQMI
ncbi:DUF58 domain-containing protein [uncultured Arcticibacterium sp.]|uniref:DUF58 domain-containing protein n=1 Tax=uncultured Arcticibacterium sp. TaxID=2173042 RepID=UPI0030F53130